MLIFEVLVAVALNCHVGKHWYNTWFINKWVITWRAVALFDNLVFVYSCSHLSASGCTLTSMFCILPDTNTPCQCSVRITNWSTLYKKSLPGASHFEIKSMSLCSVSVPGMRERMWMCRTEGKRNTEQALWFSQPGNHTESFIYSPQSGDIRLER